MELHATLQEGACLAGGVGFHFLGTQGRERRLTHTRHSLCFRALMFTLNTGKGSMDST